MQQVYSTENEKGACSDEAMDLFRLFDGFDSFRGLRKNAAVEGSIRTGPVQERTEWVVTSSREEIESELDVSGKTSFSGPAKTNTMTFEGSFYNRLRITSNSIVFLVKHRVATEFGASEIKMRNGVAVPDATPDSQKTFFRGYGSSYVSSLVKGSEYLVAYEFNFDSREQLTQFRSEIEMSLGALKGSLTTKVAMDFSSLLSQSFSKTTFHQDIIGFESDQKKPTRIEEVLDFVSSLKSSEIQSVLSIETQEYDNLGDFSAEEYQYIKRALDNYGKYLSNIGRAQGQVERLEHLDEVYQNWGATFPSEWKRRLSADQSTAKTIEDWGGRFVEEPFMEIEGGDDPMPVFHEIVVPTLSVELSNKSFPNRATPDTEPAITSQQIADGFRLASIEANAGTEFDGFNLNYENRAGQMVTYHVGGRGGSLKGRHLINRGWVISKIEAWFWRYTPRLKVYLQEADDWTNNSSFMLEGERRDIEEHGALERTEGKFVVGIIGNARYDNGMWLVGDLGLREALFVLAPPSPPEAGA